ncbi:MAG: DUF2237 domain-containing protein [Planctomycetota bacterium]|nr:DUF2237 domain-containing protein [Planctomycetota bacterium]MDW8372304.1 DUF2237 domain-containing protein [Planctomycetota bacterium]
MIALATAPRRSILGEPLQPCRPGTGWLRDGTCACPGDPGLHAVCAVMTEAFLDFTGARGNDLRTPQPAYAFPGLQAGERWCICAARWWEAYLAGCAPPVIAEATSEEALQLIPRAVLLAHRQR